MVARKSTTRKQTEITSPVVFRCTDKQTGEVLGYGVPSDSTKEIYHVTYNHQLRRYECNCPCGIARAHKVGCKHIKAVEGVVIARRELLTSKEVEQQQIAQPTLASYDVVGACLEVFNQAHANNEIGDAYEAMKKHVACPGCGKHDELYDQTGKCYWVPSYEQL